MKQNVPSTIKAETSTVGPAAKKGKSSNTLVEPKQSGSKSKKQVPAQTDSQKQDRTTDLLKKPAKSLKAAVAPAAPVVSVAPEATKRKAGKRKLP